MASGSELFLRAEHFVAAVQSRLAKDPVSVPPRLWVFQQQPAANHLWTLRQQALVGSCEGARAAKSYPGAARATAGGRAPCVDAWASGCCLAVVRGDSKMCDTRPAWHGVWGVASLYSNAECDAGNCGRCWATCRPRTHRRSSCAWSATCCPSGGTRSRPTPPS